MGNGLTKLTVNLTPRAVAALEDVALLARDSKTDSVNRAIQVYAFLVREQQRHGKRVFLLDDEDNKERVHLLL